MRIWFQAGMGAVLALWVCAGAQGQSRGRLIVPPHVAPSSGAQVVRVSGMQRAARLSPDNVIVVSPDSFLGFSGGAFPVPGLGFDYPHLAAISRGLRGTAFPRFVVDNRFRFPHFVTPFLPISLPIFAGPMAPQIIVVQQPPVVVMQQPAPEDATAEPRPAAEAAPAVPPEPVRDVGEFVLVRRDGTVVFAAAFFTQVNQLTYVTREGVRRTMRLEDLDLDATRRMNEERGTSVRLPG